MQRRRENAMGLHGFSSATSRLCVDSASLFKQFLSPQHLVMARLEIEHIIPVAQGGTDQEDNLWLACPICNRFKGDKTTAVDPETGATVALFDPRRHQWFAHFRWSGDGLRIVGLTEIGRATVAVLHLADDPDALLVRSYWVMAGWHPPTE